MREQKKYLIIYHKEDNDGVFSGALFYDYLVNRMGYKLEDLCFLGADYNMLAEFSKDNKVEDLHRDFENLIITDISFNDVSYMKKLWKEFGNNFIWCDHHAPIIKASFENKFSDIPGIRDTKRSAILNVWKFLYDQFDEAYNKKEVPELLRILSGWDSWSYEREGYKFDYVRNINKAVTVNYELKLGEARKLVHDLYMIYVEKTPIESMGMTYKDEPLINELHEIGKKLNEYDDQVMRDIIEKSGDRTWKLAIWDDDKQEFLYRNACAIFHQGQSNSTFFKSLIDTNCENGIVFKHQPNENWVVSLYNVKDNDSFHCGEFMKRSYKGGGHAGAAGCTLTQTQFIKVLKEKVLKDK
jgi:hypothetical protein